MILTDITNTPVTAMRRGACFTASATAASSLAFTNSEYMSLDAATATAPKSVGTNKRRRDGLVPLPPPPAHKPPSPPRIPPPIHRRPPPPCRLYQNFPPLIAAPAPPPPLPPKLIRVDCVASSFPTTPLRGAGLLIAANASALSTTATVAAAGGDTTDSSTATMIVRKSPLGSPTSVHSHNYFYDNGARSHPAAVDDIDDENFRLVNDAMAKSPQRTLVLGDASASCVSASSSSTSSSGASMVLVDVDDEAAIEPQPMAPHEPQHKLSLSPIMTSSRTDLRLYASTLPGRRCARGANKRRSSSGDPPPPPPPPKSFANYNYETVNDEASSESSAASSESSLALLPPSPFKPTPARPAPLTAALVKATRASDLAKKCPKKVSFAVRSSDGCSSSSSSSSSAAASPRPPTVVFANTDYFVNVKATWSSSSSSSTSSTASSSSGSDRSSSHVSHVTAVAIAEPPKQQSPTELNCFVEANRERLERLKSRRLMDSVRAVRNELGGGGDAASLVADLDTLAIKNVSARLFQKLLHRNSPIRVTPL